MEFIGKLNGIEYWYFENNDNDTRKIHTYVDGFWNFANNGDVSNLFVNYMSFLDNQRTEALAKMPKRVEFEIKVTNCFDGISEKVKHIVLGSDNMTILNEKLAELDLEHNSTLTVTIMEIK